jgi:hypothetical protein
MPATSLSLALNTWLVLRARERQRDARTFGGLPNDFLTRGAASLLVVDHVVCDEDGLAAENAMPWVSTRIFQRLREAGLLRPRPYRTMMSAEVMARLEAAGLLRFARQIMKRELRRIQRGEVATEALELPPVPCRLRDAARARSAATRDRSGRGAGAQDRAAGGRHGDRGA